MMTWSHFSFHVSQKALSISLHICIPPPPTPHPTPQRKSYGMTVSPQGRFCLGFSKGLNVLRFWLALVGEVKRRCQASCQSFSFKVEKYPGFISSALYLGILYLLLRQVGVAVGISGLCFCIYVMSFKG